MLLKGEGDSAEHIIGGAEWSTLSHDAFPAQEFDFMLSNPPYGKSWKKDLEAMGGKDALRDPRFKVMHNGEELSLIPRSSDGQMLFLANMVSKMNRDSALGSRIAEVHNGSSLFTGDAAQGESNIRRWIIENDCQVLLAPAGGRASDPAAVWRHAAENLGAAGAGRLTRGLKCNEARPAMTRGTRVEWCLRNALKAGAPVGFPSSAAPVDGNWSGTT